MSAAADFATMIGEATGVDRAAIKETFIAAVREAVQDQLREIAIAALQVPREKG